MVLFLAINATAITLFPPTGTMAVRAAAGSAAPEAIWVPTLIATTCSTLTAVRGLLSAARLAALRAPGRSPRRPPARRRRRRAGPQRGRGHPARARRARRSPPAPRAAR